MKNSIYLINFIICILFLIVSITGKSLKNKSKILPSTVFSAMWALTSLGVLCFSNGWLFDDVYARYYQTAEHLENIGFYQLKITITIFIAFLIVRIKYKSRSFCRLEGFRNSNEIDYALSKFRWILQLYFVVGLFRLLLVLSIVGFNYSAIRGLYITGRESFSSADIWLVRIGSYLLQASVFYVSMLGIKSAIKGIRIKEVLLNFALFSPFQASFGGRLFIISFFVPYIFSYLSVSLLSSNGKIRSADKHKLSLLIFGSVALIIVLAILKQGLDVSSDTISEYSSSIFYTAASYHYMNEVWDNLPSIYSLGLGGNIIGFNTSITDKIKDYWVISNNNAIIATPSMIPDVYLDFGEIGSYFFYFMLFYYLEKKAFQIGRAHV